MYADFVRSDVLSKQKFATDAVKRGEEESGTDPIRCHSRGSTFVRLESETSVLERITGAVA